MGKEKSIVLAGIWPDQKLIICNNTNEESAQSLRVSLEGINNWLIEHKQGEEWVELLAINK